MRLSHFGVEGFQCHDELQGVALDAHMTLLAGRNNVGNSALQILVVRQEGARTNLRLTYRWTIDGERLRAAFPVGPDAQGQLNSEVLDWLLSRGERTEPDIAADFIARGAVTPMQPQAGAR